MEDMEVKTGEIDAALENVYAGTIAQDEVSNLLQEIQSEQGIAAGGELIGPGKQDIADPNAAVKKNEVDEMQSKLDALKNMWGISSDRNKSLKSYRRYLFFTK